MKIAIVTGASFGLGRSFVRRLDRLGGLDEIWGVARRRNRMEELTAELSTPLRPMELDLTRPESVEVLRKRLEETGADVRVLVNAAGFGKFGTYADMTLQETGDMIALNCRAAVALTAAVLPHMSRGGRVLEICSSAAFQPLPGFNVYAATKAFLLHYSRALRWEVAPRGIRVTAVCPGWIKTEFMEVARDTKNGRTVRHYPFALRPETVARRALRDSRVLAVTTCGLPALVQRAASKFLPHCFIMACWEGLRRL
ncbi:SDR family NAD(P)-dependent oxidoreductase [uncultured Flavonifractor sp.]|uniref:SDR family NAD(P)-dependent oxidoreductase n=1 Tax=uncultured Flavonifractor sp. TaxID=1193534 RepID=UPI002626D5FE|nr:SDR family NAD(P)-dependent oxidoreductase [uncultured Flavonifractor sp.]